MLLADFIRQGTELLSSIYPSPEARGLMSMLCEERLGVKNYTHIIEPGYQIPEDLLPMVQEDLRRLGEGEPIQYVLGYAIFCDRRFNVGPQVLIPRPETELLAGEAVNYLRSLDHAASALDLCTGSGCIAWTMKLEVPDTCTVAVDVSDDALAVASAQFPSEESPLFLKRDVLDPESTVPHGPFDLIVSNPPYIKDSEKLQMRRNVLDFEPHLALFVSDEDPLVFYRAVAQWCVRYLAKGGMGLVEINETLGVETAQVFVEAGFSGVEVIDDFFGKPRLIKFFNI